MACISRQTRDNARPVKPLSEQAKWATCSQISVGSESMNVQGSSLSYWHTAFRIIDLMTAVYSSLACDLSKIDVYQLYTRACIQSIYGIRSVGNLNRQSWACMACHPWLCQWYHFLVVICACPSSLSIHSDLYNNVFRGQIDKFSYIVDSSCKFQRPEIIDQRSAFAFASLALTTEKKKHVQYRRWASQTFSKSTHASPQLQELEPHAAYETGIPVLQSWLSTSKVWSPRVLALTWIG